MLICEAAGYDVILVETVGIGQSETAVADMSDFFLALMLPGAGDELQGIKKGVVELADMIAVNKADGDNVKRAKSRRGGISRRAAHPHAALANWTPPVVTYSALTGDGVAISGRRCCCIERASEGTGELAACAGSSRSNGCGACWRSACSRGCAPTPGRAKLPQIEAAVAGRQASPTLAVEQIAAALGL